MEELQEKNDLLRRENAALRINVKSLEQEIQERCQNYMLEINRLKTSAKRQPAERSLQSSRVCNFNDDSSRKQVVSSSTCTQTPRQEEEQTHNDELPQSNGHHHVNQDQKSSNIDNEVEVLKKQFEANLIDTSSKYDALVEVKNKEISELGYKLRQVEDSLCQSHLEKESMSKSLSEKEQQLERQTLQYQIAVKQFKQLQPSIQKSRQESESMETIRKIQNCLKKSRSLKLSSKSSREEDVLRQKSYPSERILYKLKRKIEYVIVVYEIHRGIVKYVNELISGEKLPPEPKIKEEFEDVYSELTNEISRLEQNLYNTEILRESLIGEKEDLEEKLKHKQKVMKKLSINDEMSDTLTSKSSISSAGQDSETPSKNEGFRTPPPKEEYMQQSDVRPLSSSNIKLRMELATGHYMMKDSSSPKNTEDEINRSKVTEDYERLLEEKDNLIRELRSKVEKLMADKIMISPGVQSNNMVMVEEIDIPVSKRQEQYVKRHYIRTSSQAKLSSEVKESLSKSRTQIHSSLVSNMQGIHDAIEALRQERTSRSNEKIDKLERINEKIEKIASNYTPQRRITERMSDMDESPEKEKEERLKSSGSIERFNRFNQNKS